MTDRLPGYERLQSAEQVETTLLELTKLVLDAVKNGKKKVKVELEVEAKLSDDGKMIELEVESETKEDGKEEKRKVEYSVPK